jgi:hypothetical protein
LIKDELESIRDGNQGGAVFGNIISDYLERIIPSPSPDNPHYHNHPSPEQE